MNMFRKLAERRRKPRSAEAVVSELQSRSQGSVSAPDALTHRLATFAYMLSSHHEETAEHCERVAHNACTLGRSLGLEGDELQDLHWAGILHDLGKVGIPNSILLKPGELSRMEGQMIRSHAAFGADMLLEISAELAAIAAGLRSHHERWDGQGYPDGLAGEDIPLFGRILAVVDVFEALVSPRPYRGPRAPEGALDYLHREAGLHFDPELVRLFTEAYLQGSIRTPG